MDRNHFEWELGLINEQIKTMWNYYSIFKNNKDLNYIIFEDNKDLISENIAISFVEHIEELTVKKDQLYEKLIKQEIKNLEGIVK